MQLVRGSMCLSATRYLVFDTVVTARAHEEVQSIQLSMLRSSVKCCSSQLIRRQEPVSLRRLPVPTPPLLAGLGFPHLSCPILPATGPQVLNSSPFVERRASSCHSPSVAPCCQSYEERILRFETELHGDPMPLGLLLS